MNKWVTKSIQLANARGYLDSISDIYPMSINPERPIPAGIANEIKESFEGRKTKELIRLLIEHSDVFPVKDSYVGFMRKKPESIDENPRTVKRLGERLYSLCF